MSAKSSGALVSVVIPTFNRRPFLQATISPLLEDPATGEIIVVVDGSYDGSIEFLEEWSKREPRIQAVFQENAGVSVARWRGAQQARFPVVLFLDDDVVAAKGLVSGHASVHSDASRRLVLGYMPTRLPIHRRSGQAPTIVYAGDYENTCARYERDPDTIFTYFWAGNASLRRADIGVVRPDGPPLSYHEDKQLGLRCRDAGLEPVFDRRLLAAHSYDRDLARFVTECRRVAESRARLIVEYPALREELDPTKALSAGGAMAARGLSAWPVSEVAEMIVAALSRLSGRAGAWSFEVFFTRVLRQIVIFSTYRQEARSLTK